MGNYRFRLSDMMPNAWFYKLKDMSKTKSRGHNHTTSSSSSLSYSSSNLQLDKKRQPHHLTYQRKSYYISRNFSSTDNKNDNHETFSNTPKFSDNIHSSEPPRKSSKKRRSTTKRRSRTSPKLVNSSVSASCSCRASLESVWTKPDSTPEEYPNSPNTSSCSSSEQESSLPQFQETLDPIISLSPSCGCSVTALEARPDQLRPGAYRQQKGRDDQCTNDTKEPVNHDNGLQSFSKIELPPIITKPGTFNKKETEEKQKISTTLRRVSVSSTTGLKLRTNSPRITNNKRIQGSRKSVSSRRTSSVSESFAVVKSSHNPQKDFRESMVEMILENNIRASKDLEELLAAYLSLNSDEYHDLIIKVFKQIWFDITDNRIK